MEYLVRWRGYDFEGDTWEPEANLSGCTEFIKEFNCQHGQIQRDGGIIRSTRRAPIVTAVRQNSSHNARKQMNRSQLHNCSLSPSSGRTASSTQNLTDRPQSSQKLPDTKMDMNHDRLSNLKFRGPSFFYPDSPSTGADQTPITASPASAFLRTSVDLAKSGIKILVPKSPFSSRIDSERSPSEAAHSLEQGGEEPDSVPPEVAVQEKPVGVVLEPGQERARMGTRPRPQMPLLPPQVPITPTAVRNLIGKGTMTLF